MRNYKKDNFKIFSKPDGYKFRAERCIVLEEVKHSIKEESGEQPMELCWVFTNLLTLKKHKFKTFYFKIVVITLLRRI